MNTDTTNSITLTTIFGQFPLKVLAGDPGDTRITGFAMDNRLVQPGDLFVAMKGGSADGHDFIPDAVQRGAAAVVGDKAMSGLSVPYMQVENSRQALTWLAAAFYGNPGRKLTVIGVTGTDGKTTTCNLLYQILLAAGVKAGLISTVNAVIGDEVLDTGFHVTTPDAPDVQRYLARMLAAGLTHVVLETTSHGWAQYRVDACEFDIGVITNITHEHLDQHGSYENYRAAKARLFQSLEKTLSKPQGNPRLSVLNRDDSSYETLSRIAPGPQVCYGLDLAADIRADSVKYSPQGIHFDAVGPDFRVPVTSPLVGGYNVSNCLAALTAAVRGLGIAPEIAARGIAAMTGIPGRMERIGLGQPFSAIVDFAHTPNALRVAIETVRRMTENRVIVIFGSAGLRDKEKRRMMAQVAAELADVSILTAEDPRSESLDGILEEMAEGARAQGGIEEKTFWRVPDRGEAIRFGVRLAQPGDIVMAFGKGHEQSMCFGTTEFPWDDRTAMRAALSEFMGVTGPQMPYLPTQEEK
ncbi:MAG: UDP-N-acetylmuramoyl-L-alanyl-D-glutamate--2,6-diaminopimelate ligase [Anaerolineales bacterium]|nr:UDP-N-acetylmuramoyl-L-alanyl-D-glutamate--2,6-diaminopimelate ligase [Anaerolineales bacterium]